MYWAENRGTQRKAAQSVGCTSSGLRARGPARGHARRTTAQVAFEFKPKQRETKELEKTVKAMNTKKQQKQFFELQAKRDYEKMRALLNKSFDPNFHYDQNGAGGAAAPSRGGWADCPVRAPGGWAAPNQKPP